MRSRAGNTSYEEKCVIYTLHHNYLNGNCTEYPTSGIQNRKVGYSGQNGWNAQKWIVI